MFKKLFTRWKKQKPVQETPKRKLRLYDLEKEPISDPIKTMEDINTRTFQRTANNFRSANNGVAMDSAISEMKSQFSIHDNNLPLEVLNYFAECSFINYQVCALLSQHWLIDKACSMPAEDAIRNWFDISINSGGEKLTTEIKDEIRQYDKKYRLSENLLEFVRMGRVYGIRLLLFEVESSDPNYYENPFNIDGVMPGSYRGMTQIDPNWITPELDFDAASNPRSQYFYEPTWWRVNSKRIHRTHFVIMRTNVVPDILKPTYYYGGVSIPQKIFHRVYCADRTANEAPELMLTKRLMYIKTNLERAVARPEEFRRRTELVARTRNNYGMYALGLEDEVNQHETALGDVDTVIMTQYQLVAAVAEVPADKLLGTSPKGFSSTGEYEQRSYHEKLKSIQKHDLTPAVDRHYQLLIKSEIAPEFNIEIFNVDVSWHPLNETSAKEKAEINKIKADTGNVLITSGAIDGNDERNRVINDPDSGYDGLEAYSADDLINEPDLGDGEEITNEEETRLDI